MVDWLGRFIVGQDDAKKAVAVAFRNRWRRHRVAPKELQADISPKVCDLLGLMSVGVCFCCLPQLGRRQ